MFDGTEPRPSLIERLRAWVNDSEYSIAERAVSWTAAALVITLILWVVL